MNINSEIQNYLNSLPESKKKDMQEISNFILQHHPNIRLWFLDGKNDEGKVVSNPNIGYGEYTIQYKDGKSREFYRIGLSANTTGISVYIMGIEDKTYLTRTYTEVIGKASVTGYCIKFKKLDDINFSVLTGIISARLSEVENV